MWLLHTGCHFLGAITDRRIATSRERLNATTRIVPRHVGHARGSTSKIEGVDVEELLQERRPPAGRLRGGQPWGGDDRRRRTGLGRLGLTPPPARAVRIPAVVPRGHVVTCPLSQQVPRVRQAHGQTAAGDDPPRSRERDAVALHSEWTRVRCDRARRREVRCAVGGTYVAFALPVR